MSSEETHAETTAQDSANVCDIPTKGLAVVIAQHWSK
jgi:hypothetical protein